MTSSPLPAGIQVSALETDMKDSFDTGGDLITITSDSIIMNSKEGNISLHSSDDITLTSIDSVNIVGLGTEFLLVLLILFEPIVKGPKLKNCLLELFGAMEGFCGTMEQRSDAEEVNVTHSNWTAVEELKGKVEQKEKYLDNESILSNKSFFGIDYAK